jgi:hypothetical protein
LEEKTAKFGRHCCTFKGATEPEDKLMARGRQKTNKTGRNERYEHFTMLTRDLMETPAWRALSPNAQALYPWLRLEWKGPKANNNGQIILSVRQAAKALGVARNTAARAFHHLQAKGFIAMTEMPALGVFGEAKAPKYELTELGMPFGQSNQGRRLYKRWRKGADFPVITVKTNNPNGTNGKSRHHYEDDSVIKFVTF